MSHFKRIAKTATDIMTALLLILLVLVIYGKVITTFSSDVYPNYFGYTFFEVASGSMEPALHINDVIIVKVTNEGLQKNDIIAFKGDKEVITHRIIYIDGDMLTVKGDANNTIDQPVSVNSVIGKVVKVCPQLGIWKKVLTEPKILIAIFVTLLLFDFALSYNKDKPKSEGNKEEKKKEDTSFSENIHEEEKDPIIEIKKIELDDEVKDDYVSTEEKLLELTRKINIDEINKLLEGTNKELDEVEINNIKEEVKKVNEIKPEEKPKEEIKNESHLSEREIDAIDYTIRLDLNEIQKKINAKLK